MASVGMCTMSHSGYSFCRRAWISVMAAGGCASRAARWRPARPQVRGASWVSAVEASHLSPGGPCPQLAGFRH